MMAKFFKYTLVLVLFFIIEKQDCTAQKIELKMLMGEQVLYLDSNYKLGSADSIQITALKFYISDVEFWNNDSLLNTEKKSYHLIDITNPESFFLQFDLPFINAYNQIKFKLGIDSAAHAAGAMSGALDPLNGMYWTWQSGYINSKIEGFYIEQGVKKVFQFHLGGYQNPFNALQELTLKVQSKAILPIAFDLMPFFQLIDLKNRHHIMQPSSEAVLFSRNLKKCFTLK